MARRPRQYIPGMPYHIVQRGNNREACFFQTDDYEFYLDLVDRNSTHYDVDVHAFVLRTNHTHFIVTPKEKDSISQFTKVVGSNYVQYVNRTYKRTGALWEGRHKASVIDSQHYLLSCYRYVETRMVERPEEYRWSSYISNAWGEDDRMIKPHDLYLNLASHRDARLQCYRELFAEKIPDSDVAPIRKAIHYNQPMGDDRFCQQIEKKLGRRIGYLKPGRPKNEVG